MRSKVYETERKIHQIDDTVRLIKYDILLYATFNVVVFLTSKFASY